MTITTIIFDVDDTLYDVATGFTKSRTGDVVYAFMVEQFGFADQASARTVWEEYFDRYHSTAKALLVAQREGQFPSNAPLFDPLDLADYWVDHLDYGLLGGAKAVVVRDFVELLSSGLQLVAFSNGPRQYVIKVLTELGLWNTVFTETTLFAVDDVLPHCKPEAAAFQVLFDRLGVTDPSTQCVMVEDSMKNIRQAKRLGMKTVLVYGSNYNDDESKTPLDGDDNNNNKDDDRPKANDPSVDVAIGRIEDFRQQVPGLWKIPISFPE
jgi:putative hydrolase of the HAD superfamily